MNINKIIEKRNSYEKVDKKDIKKYLDLPYTYLINKTKDENGEYYVARVLEFDGLIGTGATYQEAYKDISDSILKKSILYLILLLTFHHSPHL